MSNASLIAALHAAQSDEVLERAREVIAAQDKIIVVLRMVLAGCLDAMADGDGYPFSKWDGAQRAARKTLALTDDNLPTDEDVRGFLAGTERA
jgi:hypothetical protein